VCLLVICNPNAVPKREELKNGACANPHGFGFALVIDGKIFRYRTMSARKAISKFIHMRQQNPQGYAIWHARYATHGVRNEDNCHPYFVGDDNNTVLAHNGALDVFIGKEDRRSDTRIFAEDVLPKMGGISAMDDENLYRVIEGWAGSSKIALLTTNPKSLSQLYIVNETLGTWDENGVWWSNYSHKPTNSLYYSSKPMSNKYSNEVDYTIEQEYYNNLISSGENIEGIIDQCDWCGALIDLYNSEEYCQYCEMCMSCSASKQDCMCYTPASVKRETDYFSDRMYSYENQGRLGQQDLTY